MIRGGFITAAAFVAALLVGAPAAGAAQDIVRFSTSLGNIDVLLLPQSAPQTVAHFLTNVNTGLYAHTFFHRSVPGFIIQGGGFEVQNGRVDTLQSSTVVNEPGVSNLRGTLAMAKLPSDPNSASDQWFFNLADNSSNLDHQNGGFTVFGRVLDPAGLTVMDQIAAQPVVDCTQPSSNCPSGAYNPNAWNFDKAAVPLQGFTIGQPPTAANLITTPVSVLTDTTPPAIKITTPASGSHVTLGQNVTPQFSCDDGSGTGVASCSGPKLVDTSTPGAQNFTVSTSDYAGNSASQTIVYYVDPPAGTPGGAGGATFTPVPTFIPAPTPGGGPHPSGALPILTRAPVASRSGTVSLTLLCRGKARCSGQASIFTKLGHGKRAREARLGAVRYSIAGGRRARLALQVSHATVALLSAAKAPMHVTVRLLASAGAARTVSTTLQLARR